MDKSTEKLCISASVAAGLLAGCAALGPQEATNWTPPAPGSTYNCMVESVDRVTMRAGTFDAFKIVCENDYNRDVVWYNGDVGVQVKTDMRRKAASSSGEGTQQAELVALNLAKLRVSATSGRRPALG